MTGELLQSLLGSGAITTVILAAFAGAYRIYQNRKTRLDAIEAQRLSIERGDEQSDAEWNADYRAAGEEHLEWDVDRRGDIVELRQIVNHLLERLGEKPRVFDPIPDPPRLFPRRDRPNA